MTIPVPESKTVTNLFTNPGFTNVSQTPVEVWRNYSRLARPTSSVTNFARMSQGTGGDYSVSFRQLDDGPLEIREYARAQVITPAPSGSGGWNDHTLGTTRSPITGDAGDYVTISLWMRYLGTRESYDITFRGYLYSGSSSQYANNPFTIPNGEWVRLHVTLEAEGDYDSAGFWAYFTGGDDIDAGAYVDITGRSVTRTSALIDYFDEKFSSDPDLNPTTPIFGLGSRLTGKKVNGLDATNGVVIQSTQWSKEGGYSARLINTGPYPYVTVTGSYNLPTDTVKVWRYQDKVLTPTHSSYFGNIRIGGTPSQAGYSETAENVPGETLLTARRGESNTTVVLHGHFSDIGESVWFDLLTLTETEGYDGSPFSGDTPPFRYNGQLVRPRWDGGPLNPTSSFVYYEELTPWTPGANWDDLNLRRFETGVDKGMLYLGDDYGVSWSGLVSVSKKNNTPKAESHYIDGVKFYVDIPQTEYSSTIEAFTYPEEFEECIGSPYLEDAYGFTTHNQPPRPFSFSYRTLMGDGVEGIDKGYKIHLVYNAYATESNNTLSSITETPSASIFSWDIVTLPNQTTGLAPTAHYTIDSTKVNKIALENFEQVLYGAHGISPRLPDIEDVIEYFQNA